MTLTQFAARNAFRNRRRSALTMLSVGFSLLLLTLLMVVWRAFYISQGSPSSALRIMTRHRVSLTFALPSYYSEKIRTIPGVVAVTPLDWVGGRYKDDKPENYFAQFATDPNTVFNVFADWKIDPKQKQTWQRDRTGVVVSSKLARQHGWKVGDHIYLQKNIYPVDLDLHVDGIYESGSGWDAVLIDRKYLSEGVNYLRGNDGIFATRVDSAQDVGRVAKGIDAMFRNSPAPTRSESERAFQLSFLAALGNIKAFILSISAAVVFTILLVSGNTMAMSIRERTREVAVLKTLGFTRRAILGLFIAEGITLSVAGGLLGTLGARGLMALAGASPAGAMLANMQVSLPVVLTGVAVAVLVGFCSTFLPSWHASRLDIVEGLRYIG